MKKILIALCLISLVACSKNDGGGEVGATDPGKDSGKTPTRPAGVVSGYAVDALIRGGTLSAYAWDDGEKGELLGSTITEEDGSYQLSIVSVDRPILLELVGGHYFEEASGTRVDLAARHKLRAIAYYESGKPISVMVTPWTNVAVAFAQHQMRTQNLNASNALASSASALAAIVDVDVYNTTPWDVTHESNDVVFTDELKYGLTLAAASSLTAWVAEQNDVDVHTTYTSIHFAEMMYLDVLADGVLNGNGFRMSADGSISDQVISYSLGDIPVNVELYRRQLALEMLKVVSSDYNKTQMTIDHVFSNADRFSTSTHMLWSPEDPTPIDRTGPVVSLNLVKRTLGGEVTIPVSAEDLLGLSKIEYFIEGELIESRRDPKETSITIDTTKFSDGDHLLLIQAYDTLDNLGESEFSVTFDNSGPVLTVSENRLTNQDTFTLTGEATDPTKTGLSVTVNGKEATLLENNAWSISLDLPAPENTIEIRAQDGLENVTEEVLIISKDKINPVITPVFGNARFYLGDVGIQTKKLNESQEPIYFDMASLTLGGIELSESTLTEGLVPYLGVMVNDSGTVETSIEKLQVSYRILKNDNPLLEWNKLKIINVDNGSPNYIVPFVTEYLSEEWKNTLLNDVISVNLKVEDEAGNSAYYKYNFNAYIDFPRLHINTTYLDSDITAYEYLKDGNLGGIIGECSTDDLGYCQIAIAGDFKEIQLRIEGGEYTEPATGESNEVDIIKSYIQYTGTNQVVYIHPLSSMYSAIVEKGIGIEEGVDAFQGMYDFHPYNVEPITFNNQTELSDGIKLGLQLRGISEYASTNKGTTDQFTRMMVSDYRSDGLLDGVAVMQVDPEQLEFGGQSITANTYRTDINYAALRTSGNPKLVYDYLNSIATDSNEIYGVVSPVSLDINGPELSVKFEQSWKGEQTISYLASDISDIIGITLYIDGDIHSTNNNSEGTFSIDSSSLSDGEHSFKLEAVDSIENISEFNSGIVVVDNTKPEIGLKSPATISKGSESKFELSISDMSEITDYSVYVNGELFEYVENVEDGDYLIDSKIMSELTDGSHTLTVNANDALGNKAELERTFTVDNTPPELTISSSTLTNSVDYVVSGSLADQSEVLVKVNGQLVEVDEDGNWEHSVTLSAFQTVFDIEVIDSVGNISEKQIKVDYDSFAPEIQWLTSSGEYREESGQTFNVEKLQNGINAAMNIPSNLVSIGDTEWNSSEIGLAGYMYIEPIITDTENPGSTPLKEIVIETRYLEGDDVIRDWEEWTRSSRTLPFVTEVMAPGWDESGDDVIRKIQVRATDNAGNTSEPETWEFRVHIVRDFVAPVIAPERTLNGFSKSDGVIGSCVAGDLNPQNSNNTPICLDATKVSLDGKEITTDLSNQGFSAIEVEVSDPFGEGFFTETQDLLVEYQYLKDGEVLVDWKAAPRQEGSPKTIYLPLVKETLGNDFFVTDMASSHKIQFRVTDAEGNQSSMDYDLKMDVLTEGITVKSLETLNADLFDMPFDERSRLNNSSVSIEYIVENDSEVPTKISLAAISPNTLNHQWESAHRQNRVRIVEHEEWQVRVCEYCNRWGNTHRESAIQWSEWFAVNEIWTRNNTQLKPALIYKPFLDVDTDNVAVPSTTQWMDYLPSGICESNELADAKLQPSSNTKFACPARTINLDNDEYRVERSFKHRFTYSFENEDGYPRNVIEAESSAMEFRGDTFTVINDDTKKEVTPVNGWYSIPANGTARIIKKTPLPGIINKNDSSVVANDDTVPYTSKALYDKALKYSISTDLLIKRSVGVESLDHISVSEQVVSPDPLEFSVER